MAGSVIANDNPDAEDEREKRLRLQRGLPEEPELRQVLPERKVEEPKTKENTFRTDWFVKRPTEPGETACGG